MSTPVAATVAWNPMATAATAALLGATAGVDGVNVALGGASPSADGVFVIVYDVLLPPELGPCAADIESITASADLVMSTPPFGAVHPGDGALMSIGDTALFTTYGPVTPIDGQISNAVTGAIVQWYENQQTPPAVTPSTSAPMISGTWTGSWGASQQVLLLIDITYGQAGETLSITAPTVTLNVNDASPCLAPVVSSAPCDVVLTKACVAAAPVGGCAQIGGVPTPVSFVAVSGPNGNVLPIGSTLFVAADGAGSDGSGFIRSYYVDRTGTIVVPDAGTWSAGACPETVQATPAGVACITDADPDTSDRPAILIWDAATSTTVVWDVNNAQVWVPAPGEVLESDCTQFTADWEPVCLVDSGGVFTRRADKLRVFAGGSLLPSSPVFLDPASNTILVLDPGETVGACSQITPEALQQLLCVDGNNYELWWAVDPVTGAPSYAGVPLVVFDNGPAGVPNVPGVSVDPTAFMASLAGATTVTVGVCAVNVCETCL